MVQRKVPNKLSIKADYLKTNPHLVILRPSSPQTHKMKKSKPIKRSDPGKPPPNYMKSTSSFEARKERTRVSPTGTKTPSPRIRISDKSKTQGSGFKPVRTLIKSPSFKRSSSVAFGEDFGARKATCSSTLKDSKFPDHVKLSPGGTELEGTSLMKVCPYSYCSLNGHCHAPSPPLRCFLKARRRAFNSVKSPCEMKPIVKKNREHEDEELLKHRNEDFFIEIYTQGGEGKGGGQDTEYSDNNLDDQRVDDGKILDSWNVGLGDERNPKTGLYDEESVRSEAWLEEDGDSEPDGSYLETNLNQEGNKETCSFIDEPDLTTGLKDVVSNEIHDVKDRVDYEQEQTPRPKPPEFAHSHKNQTIIYNIYQVNITVFVSGEKTRTTETDQTAIVQVSETDKMDTDEVKLAEEEDTNVGIDDNSKLASLSGACDMNQIVPDELPPVDSTEDMESKEANIDSNAKNLDPFLCNETNYEEEVADPSMNLRGKRQELELENSRDFNPRGPNFLPLEAEPDPETVDLRHQTMDERRNTEEWMVDYALQQVVTTLAPARKKKVALLVEAFEKVMPMPIHASKAFRPFAPARPMQACS